MGISARGGEGAENVEAMVGAMVDFVSDRDASSLKVLDVDNGLEIERVDVADECEGGGKV